MIDKATLEALAREHGTPLFVIDHEELRRNLREFMHYLPTVQPYYAVKANSNPEVIRTLFHAGASFDVASIEEFQLVHEHIKDLPDKERQDYIWNKIIYSHPIKTNSTLAELNPYNPLVTYDNFEEIKKVKKHAPNVGMLLRLKVPNTGAMVELSSKFGAEAGEAVDLIAAAEAQGITVEGLSFHVGSQTTNFQNFVQALDMAASVFEEAKLRGFTKMKVLDIGGGFPAPYDSNVQPLKSLAKILNYEFERLFPKDIEIIAEPGRFLVATACSLVSEVIGKAKRDGRKCYYINDGIYHTYSGVLLDHCHYPIKAFKEGETEICAVFGPTCDALDTISLVEELPELELGDLVYSENMGAYTHASSTSFNGFQPAKVIHLNQ